jgi:hypothetical protein
VGYDTRWLVLAALDGLFDSDDNDAPRGNVLHFPLHV